MSDSSMYTIEEKLIASCWVHERPLTGKIIDDIVHDFVERFEKPAPSHAELLQWELNAFKYGSVNFQDGRGNNTESLQSVNLIRFYLEYGSLFL